MPKFPQCPRCGDNLSELVPHPTDPTAENVCTVCAAELKRRDGMPDTPTVDVQEELKRAAKPKPVHAFPLSAEEFFDRGMTLRDYFAGQVAPFFVSLVNEAKPGEYENDGLHAVAAELCYGFASAMMAERAKTRSV